MTQRTCTVTTSTILQQQFRDEAEEEKVENVRVVNLKPKTKKQVKWTEDTIDNEHMNKLKSNVCCIYHKPKDAEDKSSSSCSSDDFSGNELERGREQRARHKAKCSKIKKAKEHKCNGDHDHDHHHHH